MEIPISEARKRLSHWLGDMEGEAIMITRRGKPVGVIVSPEESEHRSRVKAYLQTLRLSRSLDECGLTAHKLFDASREELEERP